MADNSDANFRYQTVKVIRGREANKIIEMERQGWEVDRQNTGKLRTEITFRHVVSPTRFKPWMGVAALFGIGVILLGGGAIAEAVGGGDDSSQATDKPTAAATTKSSEPSTSAETEPTPSAAPSETPSSMATVQPSPPETSSATAPVTDVVMTVRNSPDLKKLLAEGESEAVCKTFAKTYAGRTIEFDGSVAAAGGGTYLVYAGDDSNTEYVPGPSFQFRTLTVDGGRPAPGDNLRFVAKVGTYNSMQGLFGLTQVATRQR